MPSVFFYISGHGYGHAIRQIEVINTLGALQPDLAIVVRTAAARKLFDFTVRVPITFVEDVCDTGVVQIDGLRLDEETSVRRAEEFYRTLAPRVTAEAELLRRHDARLVVSDAPPLGTAAASAAGLPSAVLSNFTWDWIYAAYEHPLRSVPDLLPLIRDAYAGAEGWRLPMHGGFESFSTIRDLPFIVRRGRTDLGRDEIRRLLALPDNRALALVSFGGYGAEGLPLDRLDCLDDFGVVVVVPAGEVDSIPTQVHGLAEEAIYARGLRYEDVVRAVDVVVTKPGYGIISDCVAGGTALLYTSRGHFAEYDVLVREMPAVLRCGFIGPEDLHAGRWREALTQVLQAPAPAVHAHIDGAERSVALIRARV